MDIIVVNFFLEINFRNNEGRGSVNIPGVGSFDVGTSEKELKDTFLTTGIFQRKQGDSLDGRRSFKGGRIRRQISFSPTGHNSGFDLDFVTDNPPSQRSQTKPFGIGDLLTVPRVISRTSYRNPNLTQSRNIISGR